MGKKIKVKTKVSVSAAKGSGKKPVKPDMSPDSSILTDKIVVVVNKKK